MEQFSQPLPRGMRHLVSAFVLTLAVLTAATFFFAIWGIGAPGIGKRDLDVALGLAFLTPVAVYASWCLTLLAGLGAAIAWKNSQPTIVWLVALGAALTPTLWAFASDAGLL